MGLGVFGSLGHYFLSQAGKNADVTVIAPFEYTNLFFVAFMGYLSIFKANKYFLTFKISNRISPRNSLQSCVKQRSIIVVYLARQFFYRIKDEHFLLLTFNGRWRLLFFHYLEEIANSQKIFSAD